MRSSKKSNRVNPLLGWASRSKRAKESRNPMQMALDAIEAAAPPVSVPHGSLYRSGVRLSDLRPGECGTISRFTGALPARLRLMEMGLIPGVHVRMIRAAAFGGPLDVLVRGYELSLRREEAAMVWLGDEDDETG